MVNESKIKKHHDTITTVLKSTIKRVNLCNLTKTIRMTSHKTLAIRHKLQPKYIASLLNAHFVPNT